MFVAFRQERFRLTQTCYFVSESQCNLRRAVCVNPPFFVKAVLYSRNTRRSNGTVQSAVMMDRARPSYSAATTVTVASETCRLFLLSATEELLARVLTLCRVVL